jgi:strictosidine synthase-like protein
VSSVVVDIIKEVLFRNRDRRANPVLDGPLRPNSRLEDCPVVCLSVDEPDDIAFSLAGDAYVTSGRKLIRFDGANFDHPAVAREFDGLATAVAPHPDGGVVVCIAERGVAFVDGPDSGRLLKFEAGNGLRCPTAVCVGGSGEIYVCDGSRDNTPDRWAFDLMEKRSSGRVLLLNAKTDQREVLADGLAYPNGICVSGDGGSLIVSEAWTHDLLRIPLANSRHSSRPEAVMQNLPGYPARIARYAVGYCLTIFALRTQLVDFVLTEDNYRRKMIERIDPAFWIVPALRSDGHYLEPVQGGGLRKHGSLKAWAPPRSYGLVVFLDEDFEPESSLHSRVGGSCHGITGVAEHAGAVFAVSKGHNKIVQFGTGALQ